MSIQLAEASAHQQDINTLLASYDKIMTGKVDIKYDGTALIDISAGDQRLNKFLVERTVDEAAAKVRELVRGLYLSVIN